MEKSLQGFISALIVASSAIWAPAVLLILFAFSPYLFQVGILTIALLLVALLIVSILKCIQGIRGGESKKGFAIAGLVLDGIIVVLGIPFILFVVLAVLSTIP